ncbi:MAG: hypothetical protein PHU25_18460 [Deltaproteobacteria bacterium]|nr:hypothetical protein [Deltaproteobacteria bacterium]
MIDESRSFKVFDKEMIFTEARIRASADAAHLAPLCGPQIEACRALVVKGLEAEQTVAQSRAASRTAARVLAVTVRGFANVLLRETAYNRKCPLYGRFFPQGLEGFRSMSPERQAEFVRDVILPGLGTLSEGTPLWSEREVLSKAANVVTEAANVVDAAVAARIRVRSELAAWKRSANLFRMDLYARLIGIAAEKEYGRAWADGFFKTGRRSPGGDDPEQTVQALSSAAVQATQPVTSSAA